MYLRNLKCSTIVDQQITFSPLFAKIICSKSVICNIVKKLMNHYDYVMLRNLLTYLACNFTRQIKSLNISTSCLSAMQTCFLKKTLEYVLTLSKVRSEYQEQKEEKRNNFKYNFK